MGDGNAPKLPGKKAIDLVKVDNVKKGKLTDKEIINRNGELMKFMMEGDTGKFGKNKIQDILCFSFAQYDDNEGESKLNKNMFFSLRRQINFIF